MAAKTKFKNESILRSKPRMQAEIVEAMNGLHKIGAVGDAELTKTTRRMLGKDAVPKVDVIAFEYTNTAGQAE